MELNHTSVFLTPFAMLIITFFEKNFLAVFSVL